VIFKFFKMTRLHGGKRAGAGRPKGRISPPEVLAANRAKREVEELTREEAAKTALQYVAQAFETLSVVMRTAQSDQAKIAAAKEILDRGLGKAREAPPDIIKDITPNHINGAQLRPPIDLDDFRRVDR
jgi:hypothetical protein